MISDCLSVSNVALLAEGVDRNDFFLGCIRVEVGSPSSRRAWIEISQVTPPKRVRTVALLAEGVDRNIGWDNGSLCERTVALLAEGVDRNLPTGQCKLHHVDVALLAEGVDRNAEGTDYSVFLKVALLAEGVDRNVQ